MVAGVGRGGLVEGHGLRRGGAGRQTQGRGRVLLGVRGELEGGVHPGWSPLGEKFSRGQDPNQRAKHPELYTTT